LPLTLFFLLIEAVPALCGQALSDHAETVQLNQVTAFSALPNGIDLQDGDARMQIVALRQDVIRIRVSRDKNLSEDASWAVLAAARQSRVSVTAIETADAVGFQTQVLRVSISRSKFALTVSDRERHILQQDALPTEFRGSAFRVYKEMPFDEHYFGLGDKPGPLDRRDQAFTLWNTDAYLFRSPLILSIKASLTS
jgi:alpha-glucosidase